MNAPFFTTFSSNYHCQCLIYLPHNLHFLSKILPSVKSKTPQKMLSKKLVPFKKLAKKVKGVNRGECHNQASQVQECLLREFEDAASTSATTPTGFFALYVGEEKERFVVPTSFLSHPLFKMLLEKAYNEFGFEQRNQLVVPCSVSTFQEVVNAVGCCNGRFDFGNLVEEFL